jgi:hypothetical protein
LPQRGNAPVPPDSLQGQAAAVFFDNRVKRIPVGWQQRFRQTRTDQNADKKGDHQERKNRAANFQHPACTPPPSAPFIVEYGLAWLHEFIPT